MAGAIGADGVERIYEKVDFPEREVAKVVEYVFDIMKETFPVKKEKKMAEKTWSYKNYQIKEGLKPGSKHFQYFFVVSEKDKKKCNYCIWVDDETLPRFSPEKEFDKIVSSRRGEWSKWVQGKIDGGDFRNLVLKLEKTGQKEINLNEMEEQLKPK